MAERKRYWRGIEEIQDGRSTLRPYRRSALTPFAPSNSALGYLLLLILLCSGTQGTGAQEAALDLRMVAEYNLGFDCPAAMTLDPAQAVLWILMDNCGDSDYTLQSFSLENATLLEDDNFAAALEPLNEMWLDYRTEPMAFTADGALEIVYSDYENYDTHRLRLPFESGAAESASVTLTLATLSAMFPGYAGYPETTVYNADHTRAAVLDIDSLHIIDLQTGAELFQVPTNHDLWDSQPYFSDDGQLLYVATWNTQEDIDDYSATVKVYRLPDGELTHSFDAPSALLKFSPNGQYAVAALGSSDGTREMLLVFQPAAGTVSAALDVYEAPRKAMECVNDGRDLSDVDITVSGRLAVKGIVWLPDSSGFYTANTYRGEGLAGGRLCLLNYSRLRHYAVGTA